MADIRLLVNDDWPDISAAAPTQRAETGFTMSKGNNMCSVLVPFSANSATCDVGVCRNSKDTLPVRLRVQ